MSLLCPGFSDLSLGKVAAGSMSLGAGSWQQGQSLPHFPAGLCGYRAEEPRRPLVCFSVSFWCLRGG